jgi:hypothetical protein
MSNPTSKINLLLIEDKESWFDILKEIPKSVLSSTLPNLQEDNKSL